MAQPSVAPRPGLPATPYVPSGPSPVKGAPQMPRALSSAPSPSAYANPPAIASVPNGSAKHVQPRPRTLPIDDPSLSMPMVARRPWGLIIIVLLIDIGLAIAGGWLLSEGLGGKPSAPSAPPRSEASTPSTSAVASGAVQLAPSEPRTVAAQSASGAAGTAAPDTDPADPASGGATSATRSAAPATGSAAPASDPATAPTATAGASVPPGAGSAAAGTPDKPKRHRTTTKKPGGTATTSGPVDPYEATAPRPDSMPPESR